MAEHRFACSGYAARSLKDPAVIWGEYMIDDDGATWFHPGDGSPPYKPPHFNPKETPSEV